MNLSSLLRRTGGVALMLMPLAFATTAQAQEPMVPMIFRHHPHPVRPRAWSASQAPRYIPAGPLVPRVQPLRAGAVGNLGVSHVAAAAVNASDWVAIGPMPTNIQGTGYGGYIGDSSGRVSALAVDPTSSNTFYVGAAGGGVWKTTNGGMTFTPLTDFQSNLSTGAVAVSPNDHNRLYVGTGEANFSLDSRYGGGVLISANGGASFTVSPGPGNAFIRNTISRIVVATSALPNQPDTVYLATAGGNYGVYKSADSGVTWTQVYTATSPVTDLVIDPTNPLVLYAAVGNVYGSATNGVYRTSDGGATWAASGNFPVGATNGRISLGIGGTTSPATVYASVANTIPNGGNLLYIQKSSDGGTTWAATQGTPPDYLNPQGWYDNTIAVSPTDPNVVVAAGVISYNFGDEHGVVGSIDGGVTWNDYTVATNPDANGNIVTPHTDHHALAFTRNGRLLDGNDGGVWRLETPTQPTNLVWTDLNADLNTIQFTGIALHPTNPTIAYGGAQDNGTSKWTGNNRWSEILGGDGGYVRVDQDNPQTVYQEFYDLNLNRSDDGGQTFNLKTNGINPADPTFNDDPSDPTNDPINFYAPYALDVTNQKRVLFGTNHLYESLDKGDNFTPIGSPGTAGFNPGGGNLEAVGGVGANVYAAAGGNFESSADDGATWNETQLPGNPGIISDIYVSPQFPQTVYVTVAAFTGVPQRHVYRSQDGGQTFTDISGGLPDQPYNTIEVDPADGAIYVGGDNGVYSSSDNGATWARLGASLPNVQVVDLTISQGTRTLGAGTHGRGMWIYPLAGNTSTPNLVVQAALTRNGQGVLSLTLTVRNIGLGTAHAVTLGTVFVDAARGTPSTTNVGDIRGFGSSAPITVAIPDTTNRRVSIRTTGDFTEGGFNSQDSIFVP